MPECKEIEPLLKDIKGGVKRHKVSCHLYD